MITKSELVRRVLSQMQPPYDAKKVVELANLKRGQLPAPERPPTPINRFDFDKTLERLRKGGKGTAPTSAAVPDSLKDPNTYELYEGKVPKYRIVERVLTMVPSAKMKDIVRVANEIREELPLQVRPLSKVEIHDVSFCRTKMKKAGGPSHKPPARRQITVKEAGEVVGGMAQTLLNTNGAPRPTPPSPEGEAFTRSQILSAKQLLDGNGGSLVRAIQSLKLVAELTLTPEVK